MPRIIKVKSIFLRIQEALKAGDMMFLLIVGEKNHGKSSLQLWLHNWIFSQLQAGDSAAAWPEVFRHWTYTPRQFYDKYERAKAQIDEALARIGVPAWILSADPDRQWDEIIETVIKLDLPNLEPLREKYRLRALGIDDIGAHISRGDTSIYWDPYFQKLFADFTLMRPYIAYISASCPDIEDVPRVVLRHVTDVILTSSQGYAKHRMRRRFIRFTGSSMGGYTKLYDQLPVEWSKLPDHEYARYEVLRHIMSQKITREVREAEEVRDMKIETQRDKLLLHTTPLDLVREEA